MRKSSFTRRMFGCFLGLFCFVTTRSQSTYAYSGFNKQIVQQKPLDTNPGPDESVQKQTLFTVLKELNKTKGVYFLFSEQSLGNKLVNPMEGNATNVEKILDQVLKNTGLKFKKINDKTFVILSKDNAGTSLQPSPVDFTLNFSGASTIDEMATAAPEAIIAGKVTTTDGTPIPGVSVTIKGSKKGVSTNASGSFSIEANKGDVLIFSYVGYAPQEVPVGENETLAVILQENNKQLNEVVVTALGIQHKAKDLTYSTQKLTNADLTTVKDANFINSLSGKIAGVTITKSASGLGGSARVVLRGNKSTQNNQPLYVIDGVPMPNFSPAQPSDLFGQTTSTASAMTFSGASGRDGGDGISNLNPDDIESITVLKGASGAALYGSAAANGVIVITTRTGKAGKTKINFSSDVTAENTNYETPLQFKYGQGNAGVTDAAKSTDENSWGGVVNAPDHVKPFFQTGLTGVNSISLSGGTDKAQTYFSYANTSSKGIIPNSSLKKNNFNFRETQKFLNDRLTADANISFLEQQANNRPVSGLYANPLTGLYLFPRGLDFNNYKTNFQYFSPLRNTYLQNWFDIYYDNYSGGVLSPLAGEDHEQNPYWLINRNSNIDKRDRVIANVSLKYKLSDWLTIQARGNGDKSWDIFDSRLAASTQAVQAPFNGRYTYSNSTNTQFYSDLILMANKSLTRDLNLQANLGTSINDTKTEDLSFDVSTADPQGLLYANVFAVSDIAPSALISSQVLLHKQQQAVFGSAQLSYKNYLFLDLTGRNDWSSTFAFTPTEKSGYFYYSAGANLILSDALVMPDPITFAKVRASYAKVGNDVNIYSTNPAQWNISNQQGAQINGKVPFPGTFLRPEDNRSMEFGTEWRFFHDRFGFDVTYYKNNNYRQYIEVPAPLGSGYNTYYLNLGNIQNKGWEATAFVVPVQTKKLRWTSTLNFAANKNIVLALSSSSIAGAGPGNAFFLTGGGSNNVNMYSSEIKQGGRWGDIYGYKFARAADGSIMVDSTGAALKLQNASGSDSLAYVGNPNPRFTLGWSNEFQFGNFSVSFLIDGRFGGQVMSVTQAVLDEYGDSKATGKARDAGGVRLNATLPGGGKMALVNAQNFYKSVGDRNGLSEFYMYDGTAIRLRELAFGYKIPVHSRVITDLKFSLIGRNLFFFKRNAPFDPEVTMSTSNGLQGIDTFGLPSTRSIGGSLKIGF